MAKKKSVKKDPNRIPKTYNIPKPSDGIKDGEIPSLAEDAYHLIERFAYRHNRTNLSLQDETEQLISLHTTMHTAYQNMLVQNNLALSKESLSQQDCIDMTFLAKKTSQWSMPEIPTEYLTAIQNNTSQKPEERFYNSLPCFQSGLLKVNIGRMIYFELTDLNLDTLTAKIKIHDYIIEDGQSQLGRGVLLSINPYYTRKPSEPKSFLSYLTEGITENAPDIAQPYQILKTETFAELYTKIPPKMLGWNRFMVKFWEAVTLQNAVDQDEKFRRCGIDPADQLAHYFMQEIQLSNYFLDKQKPVRLDKSDKQREQQTENYSSKMPAPINPDMPIKHIRKVGIIQFISNKPPRKPSPKTARQYRIAVWTVRGHIRKYANGKTVYIKPTVKHRKALQNHTNTRPQNIIQFQNNAHKTKKEVNPS